MGVSTIDVSVIIPAYNAEHHIFDAIDSAQSQEGVTSEIIVVDNCSTDQTRAVVERRYGSSVRVVSENRQGIAFARNAGILLATGTYIALLDADDTWLPEKLQRQIAALESSGATDMVFCHGQEFYDPTLDDAQRQSFRCRPEPYAFLIPSGFMAARATFQKIGDFPPLPLGEFIAWYGWAQSLGLRTSVLPEVLVRRRVHAYNTSRAASAAIGYVQAAKWLMDRRRQAL